jgi:hypothetical protein
MYSNNFSVRIVGGSEIADGYVEIAHGTEYSMQMRNSGSVDCDAEVSIDGNSVGVWRIEAGDSINIERPANVAQKFTFFQLGSKEAVAVELEDNDLLGLVSVRFRPGLAIKEVKSELISNGIKMRGGAFLNSCSGGTGLGESSNQQFGVAAKLDYDRSTEHTINLRLICKQQTVLRSLKSATPIPPRLA